MSRHHLEMRSPHPSMDLSIVIVNWNSIAFTKACIQSIVSIAQGLTYEIIVVDNASQDDCSILPKLFPVVDVIQSERNVGFARANNLAADHSHAGTLLFLNPDTFVHPGAIRLMFSRLDSESAMGALGCRLLNGDLTLQTTCVQPFPTISNQLLAIDWIKRRWPTLPLWGMSALFSTTAGPVREVEVVSGACVMVKASVFQRIGGWSTDYFMYAEEADLCYKIRLAGFKVCYLADAEIVHFGGKSTKHRANDFGDVVMRESTFKLLKKFRGKSYAWRYRLSLFCSAITRLTMLSPMLVLPQRIVERMGVWQAFRKWRNIARWSLRFES
jgi:GT2 family glycosyltransferase